VSTGADCRFYEKTPGKWFYDLQEWPYGENPDYDTQGPFKTFTAAYTHLHENNANPGGYNREPLPGCKHDLLTAHPYEKGKASCERCGDHLDAAAVKATGAEVRAYVEEA